jgi:hypothetical protein
MSNKQVLRIDIKGLAEAQGDEKLEKIVIGSFNFIADAGELKAHPEELKRIIYLMQTCYTPDQLKAKPPQFTVHSVFTENNTYNLLVENSDTQQGSVPYSSHQEIHPNLTCPTQNDLVFVQDPDIAVLAQQKKLFKLDSDLIQLALSEKVITEKMILNIEMFSRAEEVDEELFPPHRKVASFHTQSNMNKTKIEAVKKLVAAINETLTSVHTNNTTSEEHRDKLQNLLHTLTRKTDELLLKANGDAYLISKATMSIQKTFEQFVNHSDLRKIRLQLIRVLQLTALSSVKFIPEYDSKDASGQKIVELKKAITCFNEEFQNIAQINLTENKPLLCLDKSLISQNFSQLQAIVIAMLKTFWAHSGFIWGEPKGKGLFVQRFEKVEELFNTSTLDPKQLTFAWDWQKLQSKAVTDLSPSQKDAQQVSDELAGRGLALDNLVRDLELLQSEANRFKQVTEKETEQLAKNHTTLRNATLRASQQANDVLSDFQALPGEIKVFKQHIIDLLEAAAQMELPADSLGEDCHRMNALAGKISELHDANFHSTALEVTSDAVSKVEGYQRELNSVEEHFTQTTGLMKKLITATLDMKTKLQEQRKTISAKANAIIVTRKIISVLNDVKHFSKLTRWGFLGGGIKLTVGGITYKVPTSYQELFEAQKMLQEPLTFTGALAFLAKAKSIVDRADARGYSRFWLFHVRSPEMIALQNLIKGLNFASPTFANNVDDKLDAIKPNWKMGYEDLKLPIKFNPASEYKLDIASPRGAARAKRRLPRQDSASTLSSSLQPSVSMQALRTTSSVAHSGSSLFNQRSPFQEMPEVKEEKREVVANGLSSEHSRPSSRLVV